MYILTLSAFCIKCQILYNNSTRHFFKSVMFRVLRIFNRLLQTISLKRYILNRITARLKEQ